MPHHFSLSPEIKREGDGKAVPAVLSGEAYNE